MTTLPMFPLGSVLMPGMVLPLHVFEPRYRVLVERCLAGDRRFGVALIERGSEVGGGDLRTDVATVAEIVDVQRFDDGRFALVAVGVDRVLVDRWLPDDPHPWAEVSDWPDEAVGPGWSELLDTTTRRLRSTLARAAELGHDVPPATFSLSDDPTSASHALAILAPVGPADRWRLLCAPGPSERLRLLDPMLVDQLELLEGLAALGVDPDEPDPFGP